MRKILLSLALLLVGCAQLGLEKPDSTPQRIAYGIATVTDVREQAATLVKAGTLKPIDARKVQELCDIARAGLEQSKQMYFDPIKMDKSQALQTLINMEGLLVNAQNILLNAQKK